MDSQAPTRPRDAPGSAIGDLSTIPMDPDIPPGELLDLAGQLIAGYRVERLIGQGAMGAVYEAIHDSIGQRAAIKVLLGDFAREAAFLRRFRHEARATSAVAHPGLLTIFNHGQLPDGTPYLLMEFLEGQTLRDRLDSAGPNLPPDAAVRIARQIASAMDAVHRQGIVHRDLKPSNVMLVPDPDLPAGERTKILDFGIAKFTQVQSSQGGDVNRTGTGQFIGTVAYASPEQCSLSRPVGAKADVYALGLILYEMLSGEPPFSGFFDVLLHMQLTHEPPPLRQRLPKVGPRVPAAVCRLVHLMLAKDPAARPTMAQVRDRLSRAEARRSPPFWPW